MSSFSLKTIQHRYAGDDDRPLGGYLGAMSVYGALVMSLSAAVKARGADLPERARLSDIVLITIATHRLSRLIAKDPITSPLRAPFTRYAGQSGEAELSEEVVGTGVQHTVGELITCPFCLAQWVATGFGFGLVFAPRATRLAATILTAVAGADVMQFGYDIVQRESQ